MYKILFIFTFVILASCKEESIKVEEAQQLFIQTMYGTAEKTPRQKAMVWHRPIRFRVVGDVTVDQAKKLQKTMDKLSLLTGLDIGESIDGEGSNVIIVFTPDVLKDALNKYYDLTKVFFNNDDGLMMEVLYILSKSPDAQNCWLRYLSHKGDGGLAGSIVYISTQSEKIANHCTPRQLVKAMGFHYVPNATLNSVLTQNSDDLTPLDEIMIKSTYNNDLISGMPQEVAEFYFMKALEKNLK